MFFGIRPRIAALSSLVAIFVLYLVAGLTTVKPGEVGILVKMLGTDRGMQEETLATGTHWVEPFLYDAITYDTRARQEDIPDVPSTTQDGQPINVDVSLEVSLIDSNVPHLHENIGPDYFERVILPAARSAIRNSTTSQSSDQIYTDKGRLIVQNDIEKVLRSRYESNGIHVRVNLRDISFLNKDFVDTLEQKAKAQQNVSIQERNALAAVNTAKKLENEAEGEKQKRIKAAEAEKMEAKLRGEGVRLQKEEEAKGILAIGQAEAEALRLKNEAMRAAGAEHLVAMEWAKNLGPNVKVYGIPTGAPGTSSLMDLNGMLSGAFQGMSSAK